MKHNILYISILSISILVGCTAPVAEKATSKVVNTASYSGEGLALAYVNTDSLLLNYNLSKELNEQLLKQQEDARTDLGEEARILDNELREFQRKIENNGFLNRERAEVEQGRLLKKRDEVEEMERKLTSEIVDKQREISEQLRDSIVNFLEEYNKSHNYEMILSNTLGGNVLYAKKQYNITRDVLDKLNKRYKK